MWSGFKIRIIMFAMRPFLLIPFLWIPPNHIFLLPSFKHIDTFIFSPLTPTLFMSLSLWLSSVTVFCIVYMMYYCFSKCRTVVRHQTIDSLRIQGQGTYQWVKRFQALLLNCTKQIKQKQKESIIYQARCPPFSCWESLFKQQRYSKGLDSQC